MGLLAEAARTARVRELQCSNISNHVAVEWVILDRSDAATSREIRCRLPYLRSQSRGLEYLTRFEAHNPCYVKGSYAESGTRLHGPLKRSLIFHVFPLFAEMQILPVMSSCIDVHAVVNQQRDDTEKCAMAEPS